MTSEGVGLECPECGAALEEDSRFCNACAAPLGEDEDPAPAPGARGRPYLGEEDEGARETRRTAGPIASPPVETPRTAFMALRIGIAILAVVVAIVKLSNRPSVHIEPIDIPAPQYADTPPVIPHDEAPARAPTESERALAGTWVARVGDDAPRPATSGSWMVQIEATRAGLATFAQRCVWLELYDNLRGFWNECGVVDGEPTALQREDRGTGDTSPLGVPFRWSFDGERLAITYDADMTLPREDGSVVFRQAVLALPRGTPPLEVEESFPEHPDVPPRTVRFEVFPRAYAGDDVPSAETTTP